MVPHHTNELFEGKAGILFAWLIDPWTSVDIEEGLRLHAREYMSTWQTEKDKFALKPYSIKN